MRFSAILLGFVTAGLITGHAFAHCQIPCGIYSDEVQFDIIEEHCATIEKSMTKINEGADGDQNQLARWVSNKEAHAQKIQDLASAYFLAQRIKPGQDDYEKKLVLLHQMIVAAMKCKQTTDTANVATLRSLTSDFHDLYAGKAEAKGSGAKGSAAKSSAKKSDPHAGHKH